MINKLHNAALTRCALGFAFPHGACSYGRHAADRYRENASRNVRDCPTGMDPIDDRWRVPHPGSAQARPRVSGPCSVHDNAVRLPSCTCGVQRLATAHAADYLHYLFGGPGEVLRAVNVCLSAISGQDSANRALNIVSGNDRSSG